MCGNSSLHASGTLSSQDYWTDLRLTTSFNCKCLMIFQNAISVLLRNAHAQPFADTIIENVVHFTSWSTVPLISGECMLPNDHFWRKVQEVVLGHNEGKGHRYSSSQCQLKDQWSEWQHFCINRGQRFKVQHAFASARRQNNQGARVCSQRSKDSASRCDPFATDLAPCGGFCPLVLWLAAMSKKYF